MIRFTLTLLMIFVGSFSFAFSDSFSFQMGIGYGAFESANGNESCVQMLKSTIEEIKNKQSKQQSLSLVKYNVYQNQIITPGSGKVDPESNAFQLSFTGGSLHGYSIQSTFTGILDKQHGEAIFSALVPKGNNSCNVKYEAVFTFSN